MLISIPSCMGNWWPLMFLKKNLGFLFEYTSQSLISAWSTATALSPTSLMDAVRSLALFFLYPYNFSVAGTDPQEQKRKENERLRRSLERFEAYIAETKTYCRLLSLSSFRRLYLVFHHRRRGFSHSCFPLSPQFYGLYY